MRYPLIKKIFFLIPFLASITAFPLNAEDFFEQREAADLLIHNRILATINGKTFSVMDVVKKMDVYLAQNFPEYLESTVQRFQFYSNNWRRILSQMIDNELILADAEKLKIKIPDAEVREKIYERFGPNVMSSLDKLGITYEEAWQMIYCDFAVQGMNWHRVLSKAKHCVGPQEIKNAYVRYLTENPPKEEWKYRVISIRTLTEILGNVLAQKALALIHKENLPLEDLVQRLQKEHSDPNTTVHLSEEYNAEGQTLSKSHKEILCTLIPNSYSSPISQVSRLDKSIVHRIFYLKDHVKENPPSFDSLANHLEDKLLQEEVKKEFPKYLEKLRIQFNIDEKQILSDVPKDFQPFALK